VTSRRVDIKKHLLVLVCLLSYYAPAPIGRGIMRLCASDVYLTCVCRVDRA